MRWGDFFDRLRRASGLTDRQVASLEKRKAFRVDRRFGVIGIRHHGENVAFMALDCAPTGLRIESAMRLKVGETLTLTVAEPGSRRPSMNSEEIPKARVVWVRKQKNLMTYEAGLAFLIDTPVQRRGVAYFLLEECKVGIHNPRENRKAPRVETDMHAIVRGKGFEEQSCKVRDISASGIMLISMKPLERSQTVNVSVHLPGEKKMLECEGDIVRCIKSGKDAFELGVSFTSVADDHKERLIAYLSRLLQDEATK